MGANSLIKEGVGGAGCYVSHLPHCSCLSMEKILLTQIFCSTSDRHCCETLLFPSKKSASIQSAMQEQKSIQHHPLQAPLLQDPQKTLQFAFHISTRAVSGAAQTEGHRWNASVGRGKFGKGKNCLSCHQHCI